MTRFAAAAVGLALCAPLAAQAQVGVGIGVSSTTVATDCGSQPRVHADSSELRVRVRFADSTIADADAEATVTIADSFDRPIAERRIARGQRTWRVMVPARPLRLRVAEPRFLGTGADIVPQGGCRVGVQVVMRGKQGRT